MRGKFGRGQEWFSHERVLFSVPPGMPCRCDFLCPCICCFRAGRVCVVCVPKEGTALPSERVCGTLSSSSSLPTLPSLPPFLGSWCLTQTCAFDTHTQTDDTGEGRSVMCDEWPPGRRDGISGARPLSSPPSPEGPLLGEPSPRPWDPDRRESAEALNPLGPALQRRGRATDAQDLLTIPPLHPSPRFLCRAVFFFLHLPRPLFFFPFGTRDRLKITERCGRPGGLRGRVCACATPRWLPRRRAGERPLRVASGMDFGGLGLRLPARAAGWRKL